MSPTGGTDIVGVMGGSRLLEQPRYQHEVLAWEAFLAREGPLLIEVGFDHGRRLSATAAAWANWRVVGLEVRRHRVAQITDYAAQHGLSNLFAWRVDAKTLFARYLPSSSVEVVEALFPNPWWHEGHRAKRSLLTASWLTDVARVLKPGGVLHIATDVVHVQTALEEALVCVPALRIDPACEARRPAISAQSRREWRCAQDAIPVFRTWITRD